jgi:AcrR family transcriptional regulator
MLSAQTFTHPFCFTEQEFLSSYQNSSIMEQVQETFTTATDARILHAYKEYLLNHGHQPASVFRFATDLGITEDEFYRHFGSFEGIENRIWAGFIGNTLAAIEQDETFTGFSSRDKILTFYFALFEELKKSRSFVLLQLKNHRKPEITPSFLKEFRAAYEKFISGVIEEGKASGEVAKRPFVDKRYAGVFWFHLGFLLLFWRDDNSAGFEKTDAAIEKSVNLAFDLIGKGAFDSVVDFAKFLYQTKA